MNNDENYIKLKQIYNELKGGVNITAHDLMKYFEIDSKFFRKLRQVVENVSPHTNKPCYKWTAPPPNMFMANEINNEYCDLLIDFDIKNNDMLIEKDFLFNWVTPIIGATGRVREYYDIRVNGKSNQTYINSLFIQKEAIYNNNGFIKIAFILDSSDDSFICFNPPPNVPTYKLYKPDNPKQKVYNYSFSNKDLIDKLFKAFFIERDSVVIFELERFQRISGLVLYKIKKLS